MVDVNIITLTILSVLMYIFIPPLVDGVERKIKAKIQSRVGPPTVLQTWYDILKLLSKEVVMPVQALPVTYLLPLLLTMLIVAMYLASHTVVYSEQGSVHAIALLVLLLSVHGLSGVLYTLSSNPFSVIGTFRILLLDILNEASLVTFFALATLTTKLKPLPTLLLAVSISALVVTSYALCRRLPYDLHEAEPELASGSVIDFSGPVLALYLYSFVAERYLYTSLPITITLLSVMSEGSRVTNVVVLHAATVVMYIVYSVVNAIVGRSRVDIAVKTLAFVYLATLMASLIISVFLHYPTW